MNSKLVQIIAVAVLAILWIYIRENTLPSFVVHDESKGIILLTGTSSGIGLAAALHFAKRYPDITVYCGVRKVEDGQRLANSNEELRNIHPVILDVTKEQDIQNVIAEIKSSGKPLIGVINNAGVSKSPVKTIEFGTLEDFKFHFEVNTFGVIRVTQPLLPLLRQYNGRVLIVSSIYGKAAPPRAAVYSSSKHAIEGFADVLRREVAPTGIAVSVIEPGFLASQLTSKALEEETEYQKCVGEAEADCRTYPHLYNDDTLKKATDVLTNVGDINETCEAMEHAMFASKPKTRYVTAVVGPLPAWLFLRIAQFLPDHIFDMLYY